MAGYVEIRGHSTWVEEQGGGMQTVLLLHGGLSSSDDLLGTIGGALSAERRVVAFDRRGHGRTADTDAPFHYADMAQEAIAVLEDVVGGAAHLIGFSDGGNVALMVALTRPDLVGKMVTIGANFHYSGLMPLPFEADSPAIEMISSVRTLSPVVSQSSATHSLSGGGSHMKRKRVSPR